MMTVSAPADRELPQPPAGMEGEAGPLLRLVRNQKVAFLLVGATNTVVGFLFFVLFEVTIGRIWGYLVALLFAHVFSVLCAFVLYRRFVFRVKGHVWRDLARFEMVYLVSLGINFALLPLLVEVAHIPPIPSQALIVFVTTMVSFFGHRSFSFRRPRAEPVAGEPAVGEPAAGEPAAGEPAATVPAAAPAVAPAAATDAARAARHDGTPLVSVVVPAYNNAEYLEETIESILAQTYDNLEVIIADHSSTDATREIMDRYAGLDRVTLLTTEAGGGALRNWNRVSQAATGDYIKLVCGDDLLYPWIIAEQVALLEANPGTVLAASSRDIIDAHNKPLVRNRGIAGMTGIRPGTEAARKTVREGTNIFGEPGCVLMRRAALESVGWWDSRFPYLIDEATYVRVLLTGDFAGIHKASAGFRVSDSQWSVRLAKQQVEQATGFHRWLAGIRPDVVSKTDLRIGNARAHVVSAMRRLAYVYLARRMSRSNDTVSAAPRTNPSVPKKNGAKP